MSAKNGDGQNGAPETFKPPSRLKISMYAKLSLGAFVASLCVLSLMLEEAEKLIHLGLVGNLYYVLLVPLGLSVATFLFGVLRSYAVYARKSDGGSLELGGPIVAFVLVVVLGFRLIPNPQPFDLTVFVHGDGGPQEVILRNSGSVVIDLDGDRRREVIGDKGQAFFVGIPGSFRGQAIGIAIDAPGYESAMPTGTIRIDGNSAYIAVRPKDAEFSGYVRSDSGQPIVHATINIAGVSAQSDESGFFRLTVRHAGQRQSLSLQVAAPGFATWRSQVVPDNSTELAVVVDRISK